MIFNKKYILAIAALFLFCGAVFAQKSAADKRLRREMIGVWHASPYVAAGMNDNFQFFADGRFRFNFNQMILSKRTISHAGKWEIAGGKLILTISEKEEIAGGRKVPSEMSADGFEIEGGTPISKKMNPPVKQIKILSAIKQDEIYKMISIGGVKYWKLSDDPRLYEN